MGMLSHQGLAMALHRPEACVRRHPFRTRGGGGGVATNQERNRVHTCPAVCGDGLVDMARWREC